MDLPTGKNSILFIVDGKVCTVDAAQQTKRQKRIITTEGYGCAKNGKSLRIFTEICPKDSEKIFPYTEKTMTDITVKTIASGPATTSNPDSERIAILSQ